MVELGTERNRKRKETDYCRDKDYRVASNRCDICADRLDYPVNIEAKISQMEELNYSYENEYDKVDLR